MGVATIASALDYCHSRGIVHRDLKPENILLTSKEDDGSIKIADFGFAKQFDLSMGDESLTTSCGTPGYVAPEILNGKSYGAEVDMWSFGVIIYILLCGYPPFHDDNQKNLFAKIRRGEYDFDPTYWNEVSETAKDLIRKLLVVDGKQRYTIKELLAHPWMLNEASSAAMPKALAQLKKWQAQRRWKRTLNTVRVTNLLKQLTQASRDMEDGATAGEGGEEGSLAKTDSQAPPEAPDNGEAAKADGNEAAAAAAAAEKSAWGAAEEAAVPSSSAANGGNSKTEAAADATTTTSTEPATKPVPEGTTVAAK